MKNANIANRVGRRLAITLLLIVLAIAFAYLFYMLHLRSNFSEVDYRSIEPGCNVKDVERIFGKPYFSGPFEMRTGESASKKTEHSGKMLVSPVNWQIDRYRIFTLDIDETGTVVHVYHITNTNSPSYFQQAIRSFRFYTD